MEEPTQPTVYRAVVRLEEDGTYWAEVPELPGCFTRGETLDKVYHNLPEAISCHTGNDEVQVVITMGARPGAKDVAITEKPIRQFGSVKGLIHIAEDFDEPLEDFRELMA